MIDADNVTDRLTGKMLESTVSAFTKAASQIGNAIVFFICSAAATATDPFFRKNMGERYFTPARAVISTLGWFAVILPDSIAGYYLFGKVTIRILLSLLIPIAYIVMAKINLNAIRDRRLSGELWHSKSGGESVFGSENPKRDLIIEVIAFIALIFVSFFGACFFLMSRLMAYAANATAFAVLYNRYLDIQDGRIEAEFMETALRDGFPPKETAGYYRPLPNTFTGERRANIARIVTGGPFIAPPKTQTTETGKAAAQAQPAAEPFATP